MKYTTIAVLSLQAGVLLGLTESQAATRKTALTAVPGRRGWYLATGPVQFKRGEEFLHDDELPKHLAEAVESGETQKAKHAAKAKAKEKAEAEAKAKAEALAREQAEAEAAAEATRAAEAEAAAAAEAAAQAAAAAAGKTGNTAG